MPDSTHKVNFPNCPSAPLIAQLLPSASSSAHMIYFRTLQQLSFPLGTQMSLTAISFKTLNIRFLLFLLLHLFLCRGNTSFIQLLIPARLPLFTFLFGLFGNHNWLCSGLFLIQYSGITPGRVQGLYECWQWLCAIKYLIYYISLAQLIYYLLLFGINGVHTSGKTPGTLLRKSDDAGDQNQAQH